MSAKFTIEIRDDGTVWMTGKPAKKKRIRTLKLEPLEEGVWKMRALAGADNETTHYIKIVTKKNYNKLSELEYGWAA